MLLKALSKPFIQLSIVAVLFYFADLKWAAGIFAAFAVLYGIQSAEDYWMNPKPDKSLTDFGDLNKRKQ